MLLFHEILNDICFKCPLGKSLDTCIFNEVRLYHPDKRKQYIESLSMEHLLNMVKEHKYCVIMREKSEDFDLSDNISFQLNS